MLEGKCDWCQIFISAKLASTTTGKHLQKHLQQLSKSQTLWEKKNKDTLH